jgi:hypothetical protein
MNAASRVVRADCGRSYTIGGWELANVMLRDAMPDCRSSRRAPT